MPSNDDLTVDGYPIGQIVVAGNATPRRDPEPEDSRETLVRQELAEIADTGDADAALAEVYDGYLDKAKRRKALDLYLVERKSFDEIAKAVGVPPRTVSMWSYTGRWDVALRREIQVEQEHSLLQLTRLRTEKRVAAAKRQLEAADEVRETALKALRTGDASVKSAAEAIKTAADTEARILGISESGAFDRGEKSEAEKQAAAGGKTPLVQIFQGGLPPIRVTDAKTVDTEGERK